MGVKGRIDLVQKLGLTVGMGLVALHYIHVLTQVVNAIEMIHNEITVRQLIELNSCEYFVWEKSIFRFLIALFVCIESHAANNCKRYGEYRSNNY